MMRKDVLGSYPLGVIPNLADGDVEHPTFHDPNTGNNFLSLL